MVGLPVGLTGCLSGAVGCSGLFGRFLKQLGSSPGVVLPQQHLLVVDEFGTLSVGQLASEMLVLQLIQEIETHGIFQIVGVLRLFPVQ